MCLTPLHRGCASGPERHNAFLEDEDEHRAITRNLLHQPGTVTYAKSTITVTLRPPDAPRVARALGLLCDQLNANPPA